MDDVERHEAQADWKGTGLRLAVDAMTAQAALHEAMLPGERRVAAARSHVEAAARDVPTLTWASLCVWLVAIAVGWAAWRHGYMRPAPGLPLPDAADAAVARTTILVTVVVASSVIAGCIGASMAKMRAARRAEREMREGNARDAAATAQALDAVRAAHEAFAAWVANPR